MNVVKIVVTVAKAEGEVELTCFTDSSSILYLYDREKMYFKHVLPVSEWKTYVNKHFKKIPLENLMV